jgi:hypothetical protein
MAKKKSAKQEFFDVLKSVGELEYLGCYYRQRDSFPHRDEWLQRATVKYKGHDTLFEVRFAPHEPSSEFCALRHDRDTEHVGSRPYYHAVGGHDFNQRYSGNRDGFVKWVKDVWDSTSMSVRPDGVFGSFSSICMHDDDNLADEVLQKKLAEQKSYKVELHYDASIQITVKASDDKEAIKKAIAEAVYASAQRFQFGKRTSEQIIK